MLEGKSVFLTLTHTGIKRSAPRTLHLLWICDFGGGMNDDLESRRPAAAVWRRLTLLVLGVLSAGFLASLYLLADFPARVNAASQLDASPATAASGVGGSNAADTSPSRVPKRAVPAATSDAAPPALKPAAHGAPVTALGPQAVKLPQNKPLMTAAMPGPADSPAIQPVLADADSRSNDAKADDVKLDLDAALDELKQSRESLLHADEEQRRAVVAGALFLGVFILIVALVVVQVLQLRNWKRRSQELVARVEAIVAQLRPLQDAQQEVRRALPQWLQEVGDQPLSFQEEGLQFSAKALNVLEDIDHLAYVGNARLSFGQPSSQPEAAVYLNGLLLSAAACLARSDVWAAFARLDRFFELVKQHPEAVERHRVAQAYSYRALTAYQVLDRQDAESSWLRKSERAQTEAMAKQAFADLGEASRLDPDWRHTIYVEALLCSRFYIPNEVSESSSRGELFVRGLRRAIVLYKGLIEEKCYRGPSRRNLARCLKRVAELTGEKADFSDFGYTLSSFPTDEELADETLAARQPSSQDRFLWQWMLGDAELFRSVERLNLVEYRSFWIRLLDNKVHLRNWRADLAELEQRDPIMREWGVQLLHVESPISLANPLPRRQDRFGTPSSGTSI
jgi:hypothetical protein